MPLLNKKEKKVKVEQGQIWQVLEDMPAKAHSIQGIGKRKVIIEKGEYIEIRFPYAWHFRTVDNFYAQVGESLLLKNCKLVGKIWHQVSWQNKADLEEILKLNLYDYVNPK